MEASSSPRFLALLLFTLPLIGRTFAQQTSCTLDGKTFQSAPDVPISGPTKVCFCNAGAWERCKTNLSSGGGKRFAITEQESRSSFEPADFVFDLKGSPSLTTGTGGTIQPLALDQLPALAGQGVSYTLFNLEPCGINLPHVHPRATELLFLISGDDLQVAFTEENGGRTIVNSLKEGQATFFPQGLIHFEQNLGCKPVNFISALNSEDPGVLTISERAFTLPTEALQATFALSANKIELIKKGIPAGPAKGRMECLKRCKLDSEWNSESEKKKEEGGWGPE